MASGENSRRKVNWASYTNFRSRHSAADLSRLCAKISQSRLREIFATADETGLFPIHWAAINNRSDMIEFMLNNSSPLRVRCANKLFADGSALHLAAMNGSIEAANLLLRKSIQQRDDRERENNERVDDSRPTTDWLRERDVEGQTPLMRSAAPRSKRLDTVRDLLRKNLWSLSGRPAEMASLLISLGADWRETDSIHGMNLMHLAIVNDCDDIVHLLLVLDASLISIPAKLESFREKKEKREKKKQEKSDLARAEKESTSDFHLIDLNDRSSTDVLAPSASSSPGGNEERPLIGQRERVDGLISSGLSPLQLAIIYGRLSVIRLLWKSEKSSSQVEDQNGRASETKNEGELRKILLKACWSNKTELFKLMRVVTLRTLLSVDLALLSLIWLPICLGGKNASWSLQNIVLVVSYCLTLAMALKVMIKSPKYLRQNSSKYRKEISALLGKTTSSRETQESTSSGKLKSSQSQTGASSWNERVRLLCHKCRCLRRRRTRHCDQCGRCVVDFDHHCIYLGNCVGRDNRVDLLLMLVLLTSTSLYALVLNSRRLERNEWEFWSFVGFLSVAKYLVVGSLSSFSKLLRASLGVTMYESIRSNRIRSIFGPSGPPESISRSHKMYSTSGDSFWRYSPDRFLTGDLPASQLARNLKEFAQFDSVANYLALSVCGRSDANSHHDYQHLV